MLFENGADANYAVLKAAAAADGHHAAMRLVLKRGGGGNIDSVSCSISE